MKRNYEIAVISKGAFARTVRIFAPKRSDRAIIMHDGQNVFRDEDAAYKKSWRAARILKELGIKNTAIIGIDCTATRNDDYMPFPSEIDEYGIALGGGKADAYTDYLEQAIVPYLNKRFGFTQYGMLGSSAGALATLYFAAKKNSAFTAYGMFSTPLFVSGKAFERFFDERTFDPDAHYSVYAGGNEQTGEVTDPAIAAQVPQLFVNDAFAVVNGLRKSEAKDIRLLLDNRGIHDETCWREPAALFFKSFAAL